MTRARLGQNFLVDEVWQKRIVDLFKPSGLFIEVGPGRGALTEHLRKKFKDFFVFELDAELAEYHRRQSGYSVIFGDFASWDFKLNESEVGRISFIGNLPYESGTAMVRNICEHAPRVDSFLFLLQKEVVERMTAKPRTRDYGSLSVLVQGQFHVEALDVIPAGAFRPQPLVLSQLIRGSRRIESPHPVSLKYFSFLKQSFMHKRKTLKNAWKSFVKPEISNAIFERFQLKSTSRAEELEVDLWPQIYEVFEAWPKT